MKDFFEDLFMYNCMVNDKIIEALQRNKEKLSARTMGLAAHIVLVHDSWNRRMTGQEGIADLWQMLAPGQMGVINAQNLASSVGIIKQEELDASFSYRNSKGVAFSNTYRDVLFHLINHSSYHRGQVNADLRHAGVEPVVTEYIFYKR